MRELNREGSSNTLYREEINNNQNSPAISIGVADRGGENGVARPSSPPTGTPVMNGAQRSSLDPNEVALCSGWMKMRHPVKLWVSRWFVLRQGVLTYYRDEKGPAARRRPSGAILLAECEVRDDRISKDGMFSLKIENMKSHSVYKTKSGFKLTPSLRWTWNYCVLRVASESARRAWIQAIAPQIEYATSHKNSVSLNFSQEETEDDDEDESETAVSGEPTVLNVSPKVHRPRESSSLSSHVYSVSNSAYPNGNGTSTNGNYYNASNYREIYTASSTEKPAETFFNGSKSEGRNSRVIVTLPMRSSYEGTATTTMNNNQSNNNLNNNNNNQGFQKNLVNGLHQAQKKEANEQQARTMSAIEQWKNDLGSKMRTVESRIMRSVDSQSASSKSLDLSPLVFVLIVLVVLLLGRLAKQYGPSFDLWSGHEVATEVSIFNNSSIPLKGEL